ncbi:MAG: LuxR C-terminal-related transcriptional regulator [Acidimicrobiales bacterium]
MGRRSRLVGMAGAGPATVIDAPAIPVSVMGRDAILRSGLASHLRPARHLSVVAGVTSSPGVVVLATDLIDIDTLVAVRAIRAQGSAGIVLLASRFDADDTARAAGAGACQALTRGGATSGALAEAVTAASGCGHRVEEHGRLVVAVADLGGGDGGGDAGASAGEGTAGAGPGRRSPELAGLPVRHLDVLRRISEGQSTLRISEDLAYSESTIKNIVQQLVAALGAHNRTHAVTLAIRRGVI